MVWIAGAGLGLMLAASAAAFIAGLWALVRRRWRSALALVFGMILLAGYLLTLGGVAFLLGPAQMSQFDSGPSEKARALGENISALMNVSCWGLLLGVTVGVVRVVRARRPPVEVRADQ